MHVYCLISKIASPLYFAQFATHNHLSERQWFSILPLGSSGEDHAAKFEYLRQSQGKEIDAKVRINKTLDLYSYNGCSSSSATNLVKRT